MTAIRPFPWSSLDSLRRADIEALRDLRRWCASVARLDTAAVALDELLGARIGVSLRRAQRGGRVRNLDDSVGVVLARADAEEGDSGALLEVEGALAAAVVARALKRPPPRVSAPSHPPSPGIAGAFAAVLVAVARRAHAGSPLVVLGAGPAAALGADVARGARDIDIATFTVTLDHDAYLARLTVPQGRLRVPSRQWDRASLRAMRDTPVEIPIVAAASGAALAEAGALETGDVWLPGKWPLRRVAPDRLAGPVLLAAGDLDYGLRAELGEDGRLVLRDGIEAIQDGAMSESDKQTAVGDPVVDSVGEVPVIVRVEVGAARLRAKEWAALEPGDVVALGRKIADPVVLRIGGAEVARGELVEVEGEIGVRILARTVEGAG